MSTPPPLDDKRVLGYLHRPVRGDAHQFIRITTDDDRPLADLAGRPSGLAVTV